SDARQLVIALEELLERRRAMPGREPGEGHVNPLLERLGRLAMEAHIDRRRLEHGFLPSVDAGRRRGGCRSSLAGLCMPVTGGDQHGERDEEGEGCIADPSNSRQNHFAYRAALSSSHDTMT